MIDMMIKKKIKDEQVLSFLKNNPDFFIKNSDVLDKINFPVNTVKSNDKDNIITFKDWIIENLKNTQKNIIDNARYNFFTQKRIHNSVIEILKKQNKTEFFNFLINELPNHFDLEIINIVTSNSDVSKKYNLQLKKKELLEKIYGVENQLILDAVDHELQIFEESKKIYSNAIFSLSNKIFNSPSLLIFGSKDKHFIDNKAYELILFFSNVVQEKLNQFSND